MKIDRTQHQQNLSRADFVNRSLLPKPPLKDSNIFGKLRNSQKRIKFQTTEPKAFASSVNLFEAESLSIFTKVDQLTTNVVCKTWVYLEEKELHDLATHPPRNHYEKLSRWTAQGKVCRFPTTMSKIGLKKSI